MKYRIFKKVVKHFLTKGGKMKYFKTKVFGLSLISLFLRIGIGSVALAGLVLNWNPSSGVPISQGPGNQGLPKIIQAGGNSFIIFFDDDRAYTPMSNADIYGQKINSGGNSLWNVATPPDGRLIVDSLHTDGPDVSGFSHLKPLVASDGGGGAITAWRDRNTGEVKAKAIDGTGNPAWAADVVIDVAPSSPDKSNAVSAVIQGLAPNGVGNATWIVWRQQATVACNDTEGIRLLARRVDNNTGALIDPPITLREKIWDYPLITSWFHPPEVVSDGAGGIIASWINVEYIAQSPISYVPYSGPAETLESDKQMLTDMFLQYGAGAPGKIFNLLLHRPHNSPGRYERIYGQRLNILGAPVWPSTRTFTIMGNNYTYTTGREIVKSRLNSNNELISRNEIRVVSDNAGGAVLIWQDDTKTQNLNDLSIQRVNPAGTPLYADPGTGLTDFGRSLIADTGEQIYPSAVYTGGAVPGIIVSWMEATSTEILQLPSEGMRIRAQKIDLPTGNPVWLANPTGLQISTVSGTNFLPTMADDGAGGAYILWNSMPQGTIAPATCQQDTMNLVNQSDIFVARILDAGVTGVLDPTVGGISLTGTGAQLLGDIVSDGAGGAIVAWGDGRSTDFNLYAQRISPTPPFTRQPFITGFTPNQVDNDTRPMITISGSNFNFGASVQFISRQTGNIIPGYKNI